MKKIVPAITLKGFLFLLILLALSVHANAEEKSSPRDEALKLQKLYKNLTSLSFNFQQATRSGGRERRGSGNAVFVKTPGTKSAAGKSVGATSIMRWNYTTPDRQVIINDGETLSIYTEKDKQLIKTSARELETDITYAFFAGTRDLLDDFDPEEGTSNYIFSSAQELKSIRLVPRQPHNQIKSVQVWYDGKDVIHHIMIEDHFESITELNFDNIRFDTIPDVDSEAIQKILSFTPPSDTEIITQ